MPAGDSVDLHVDHTPKKHKKIHSQLALDAFMLAKVDRLTVVDRWVNQKQTNNRSAAAWRIVVLLSFVSWGTGGGAWPLLARLTAGMTAGMTE